MGLDQAQAEVHVTEQAALLGRRERRPARELDRASGIVEQRSGDQELASQARVKLGGLTAERRDADCVLEQPAGVRMVIAWGRGVRGEITRIEDAAHRRRETRMRQLADEELEEALQLVDV